MSDAHQTEHEPLSVLLVDDEENILKALQRLLMDEDDIEIVTATSGEEGLKLLPDLSGLGVIVSDQRMPGMQGSEFLARVQELYPETVRILLTGHATMEAAIHAVNAGGYTVSSPNHGKIWKSGSPSARRLKNKIWKRKTGACSRPSVSRLWR